MTTHDPYFISLRTDEKIYKVYRNNTTKGVTNIEEMSSDKCFLEESNAEINYIIFDIPSFDYCLSLYSKVEDKHGGGGGLKGNPNNKDITLNNGKTVTIRDFRNQMAHGNLSIVDPDKSSRNKPVVTYESCKRGREYEKIHREVYNLNIILEMRSKEKEKLFCYFITFS